MPNTTSHCLLLPGHVSRHFGRFRVPSVKLPLQMELRWLQVGQREHPHIWQASQVTSLPPWAALERACTGGATCCAARQVLLLSCLAL